MGNLTKILIPTYKPGGLKAKVYPHWKDAPFFTEICLDERKSVIETKVLKLTSDELIISMIRKEGIKNVIALSLSTRALELLNKCGVLVFTGNVKTVSDAIEKYKKGELYLIRIVKLKQKEWQQPLD